MVIKKTKIFFLISFIFVIYIGIKNYNINNVSTGQYQLYIDTDLYSDKKNYDLNNTIKLSIVYRKKYSLDKNIQIKFCLSENEKVNLHIIKAIPPRYKEVFPEEYWINEIFYDKNYKDFYFKCPQELSKNEGFLFLDEMLSYKFNFELKFIKEYDKYFLVNSGGDKIQVSQSPNYYSIGLNFKEGFFSSNDMENYLDNYIYLTIKNEQLYMFIAER